MGVGSLKAKTKAKPKKTLAASALQDCNLPYKMGVFLPNDAPYSPEYEDYDAETGVITYTKDNFKKGFGREEFSLRVRAADVLSACRQICALMLGSCPSIPPCCPAMRCQCTCLEHQPVFVCEFLGQRSDTAWVFPRAPPLQNLDYARTGRRAVVFVL
jgi:hypothetical protein